MSLTMSKQAWGLLITLSAMWGASFLFIEMALLSMGPITLVFFRVLIGAATLGLVLLVTNKHIPTNFAFWRDSFVMGFLNNAIPFTFIAYGQVSITGGMASIINANTAFFGVMAAAIFLVNERLTFTRLCGVLIGVSGVVIVMGPAELLTLDVTSLGQLAVILATLSYALASVWGRLRLQGYDGTITAFGMTSCATVLLAIIMLMTDGIPSFEITARLWIVAIGLGVIGTALAYMVYFKLLALAGASNLMLVTIIVPIFAVSLDAVILSQWVSVTDLLGFVVIAVGLLIMDGRLSGLFYRKT